MAVESDARVFLVRVGADRNSRGRVVCVVTTSDDEQRAIIKAAMRILGSRKSEKKTAANRLKQGGRPKGSKDSYKRTRRKKEQTT